MYESAFEVTRRALEECGLPSPMQVHLDWFLGSKTAAKKHFPGIRIKRGVEHMRRNLRHNQSAGSRSMGHNSSSSRQRPVSKKPHLASRSIYAVLNVVSELMWCPTACMLHVCLDAFLCRVRDIWQEVRWHDYFVSTYCLKKKVDESIYGTTEIWQPEWWCGVAAQKPGLHSTQQPAEQMNCALPVVNILSCARLLPAT